MNIDIYTFAVALGIIYIIQATIFVIQYYYHKNYQGPGWWVLWNLTAILGFAFMLSRQIQSFERVAILGQNSTLIVSTIFLYFGIMRFLGQKGRMRLLISVFIVFVAYLSYYTFLDDNIHLRSIAIWLISSFITIISAYDLYKYKSKSVAISANICIMIFLGHGLFSASKVIFLLSGQNIPTLTAGSMLNISSYIEMLVISIFWTFSLIMMVDQRLTSEMKIAKDHFEVLFDTSPDAIIITSLSDGSITSINDKFYELSGYTKDELIGKTTLDLNLWTNSEERSEYVSHVHKHGYYFDYETVFQVKNHKLIPSLMSSKVISLNEKLQMVSIIRDISPQKKREMEILEANLKLQTTISEKDKFFSIIAHDLRNPFSTFLGLTEVIADESNDLPLKEVIQYTAQMRDSARNLFGLLENLLEWSMLKQGLSRFLPVQKELIHEIKECSASYSETAAKKQIALIYQIPESTMVYADPNMLRSLIRNLLSNAIKFTPVGGSVTIYAETQEDNSCVISIKDTGIGLSEDLLSQLFKIGSKTARTGTNGEGSSGLGLLLCKEFVTKHNGEIWAESREGEGCVFYVKLPSSGKV